MRRLYVMRTVLNIPDGVADGVIQGREAARGIVFACQRPDLIDRKIAHDPAPIAVEFVQRYGGFSVFFLFLLLNKMVETANNVLFRALHGSALINDKNDFQIILVHSCNPLIC